MPPRPRLMSHAMIASALPARLAGHAGFRIMTAFRVMRVSAPLVSDPGLAGARFIVPRGPEWATTVLAPLLYIDHALTNSRDTLARLLRRKALP